MDWWEELLAKQGKTITQPSKQAAPQQAAPPTETGWQMPGLGLAQQAAQVQPRIAGPIPSAPIAATRTTPLAAGFEEGYQVPITELTPAKDQIRVLGESISMLPQQTASTVLQAIQGENGASVVNRDWMDTYIQTANQDIGRFVQEVSQQYPDSRALREAAQLSQNLAYSVTSMGAGLAASAPLWLAPEPTGATKAAAMATMGAVSGAVSFRMVTYQITQQYLEFKDAEKRAQTGQALTLEEETQLKSDFHDKAVKYGLWEAIPEGISNMLFSGLLTGSFKTALVKVVGKDIAQRMTGTLVANIATKAAGIYGEELLTETITQKGQAAIELEAGLREGNISWLEAFKEIAPQTFLLTTVMAGAGQTIVSAKSRIENSLKGEVGEDNALYDTIIENVAENWDTLTGVPTTTTPAPTTAMSWWETGNEVPGYVQQQWLSDSEALLDQLPTVQPNAINVVPIADGEVAVRTDAEGKAIVEVTSRMRGNQLTLENIAGITGKREAALKDVADYLVGNNIVAPPSIEQSPQFNDWYTKYVEPRMVTTAMAEGETVSGMPIGNEGQLRQTIMATVKSKGMSESKYRALFQKAGKTRNLTEMSSGTLQKVLTAVQEARPVKLHGKNVITAKTENAIQTLKDVLIAEKKLTPEIYEGIKEFLDLPTDKYEGAERFITERQARSLIRQVTVEAEVGITEWDTRVAEGLVNKPQVRGAIDRLSERIVTENKPKKGSAIPFRKTASEISEYPNDVGLSGTMSILRALRRFQEQLGGRAITRIYEVAELMIEQRRLNDIILANEINAMKMKVPQLATVVHNKNAMARIQQWLDADLKIADVKKPDLVPGELEVAQLFRERYDQWKNAVRVERFKDAYYHYGGRAKESVAELIKHGTEGTSDVAIPDAPVNDLKEAIEIYETQGEAALKTYLGTKEWGVLKSGYSFSQIIHPQLRMGKRISVRAATTSLHQRKGLDFLRDEKTAWERLVSYERQMIGLNLQPYYRKMDVEFRKIAQSGNLSPESAREAASKISLFMQEVKGYPMESPIVSLLLRIGGWSFGTLSKVPWMSVRNIHQNIAFGADKAEIVRAMLDGGFFINAATKRGRLDYTDALVHQYKGVQQEQILMGYMGKTPLENLIRRTDYYHLSDKLNRYLDMNGYGAKAERALNQYLRDGDAENFLKNSGANELSATEQVKILEYLALDNYGYGGVLETVSGGEAAIRDIAAKRTTLDHFNYVRYLRSVMEMGESGRIIGSLVAFPRSVAEKYADIFSRTKRLKGADRRRAIHSLMALVIGSVIASAMLKQLTGKDRDAYNPLLILQWQVGGLAIGATQNLMELYRLVTNLSFAQDEGQRKYYFDEIILLVPQLGDSFIPFYAPTMNMLESLTDSRYLDRKWLRQLREVFDKNYEMNEEYYEIERDWLEKVQHGLFGTRTPDPTNLEQALKKLGGIETNLGQTVEEELYTTSKLGSDIDSAVYSLDPSEIITENGFTPLVLERMEYQGIKDRYFEVNADNRYDYRANNPNVDAQLFFWSYVVTLQSDEAKQIVLSMIDYFGVPPTSIRGYEKVFMQPPTEGTPPSGTTETPPSGETPSSSGDWWENITGTGN